MPYQVQANGPEFSMHKFEMGLKWSGNSPILFLFPLQNRSKIHKINNTDKELELYVLVLAFARDSLRASRTILFMHCLQQLQ